MVKREVKTLLVEVEGDREHSLESRESFTVRGIRQTRGERRVTIFNIVAVVTAVLILGLVGALVMVRSKNSEPIASDNKQDPAVLFTETDQSDFMSSSPSKTFEWKDDKRTLKQALDLGFQDVGGWKEVTFTDGFIPWISEDLLLTWIENELIGENGPFATFKGKVPLPYPETKGPDQVDPDQWVAYSRRQVCYIAAKSLLGAELDGYANGLVRMLEIPATMNPAGVCTAISGDLGRSLWQLLAACAADPLLKDGGQGPMLLVAKAKDRPSVDDVRSAGANANMASSGLKVCQYADYTGKMTGIPEVPAEGCTQPTAEGPGKDFMTGGLPGQAVQDISAAWIGGYTMTYTCGLSAGQDERLLVYMPEVFALSFFLSEAPGTNPIQQNTPQLRQPAWILGARRISKGLDGTAHFNAPPVIDPDVPMTKDLVIVNLKGSRLSISSSMPFVAFMSENQNYFAGLETQILGMAVRQARVNRNVKQREVSPDSPYAFEKQVRAWYGSMALTSYGEDIRPVLKEVVKSIGVGPWMSGLWWGDSQLGFLAMWIGHSIAASTWGSDPLPLHYYIYATFTENPGNQCYVYSGDRCRTCVKNCGDPPGSSFWMPGYAYSMAPPTTSFNPPPPPAKPCVVDLAPCGQKGVDDMYAGFNSVTAQSLWDSVEKALRGAAGDANNNVFDVLLG